MGKMELCVICGGQSAEHEVSLESARNVIAAVDRARFNVTLVGIDKGGAMNLYAPEDFLLNADDPAIVSLTHPGEQVAFVCVAGQGCLARTSGECAALPVDVAFPVLHGPLGEDGGPQGMLKMVNIPFVGCDIASSAVCMDKSLAKMALRQAGLPVARASAVDVSQKGHIDRDEIVRSLGLPLFVKPVRLGSSVGITKVHSAAELLPAIDAAFRFDTEVLIEEYIAGREIECAVLGNRDPRASVLGEVIPIHEFYSYEAKYLDDDGAELRAPADLDDATATHIRELAVASFKALSCSGMARVDFFLRPDGDIVVNEVNSIPGFTRISMFPRLWGLTGMAYPALVEELIRLALERFEEARGLSVDYRD